MSSSSPYHVLSSSLEFSRLCLSYCLGLATLFRSDFVSWFTRVTPSTLDRGSVVGAFHRILEHPRQEKPNHHFSIQPLNPSTPQPITYAYSGTPMVIVPRALPILRQIV